MTVLELKTHLKRRPKQIRCDARTTRLFLAKKRLSGTNVDWLGLCDDEVGELARFDCFKEVVDKFTRPEFELHDEKRLRDYFPCKSLWRGGLDHVDVLVYVPPPFLWVYCEETNSVETPEFVTELRSAIATMRRKKEEEKERARGGLLRDANSGK